MLSPQANPATNASPSLISVGQAVPFLRRPALKRVASWLDRRLHLAEINRIHDATRDVDDPADFLRAVLEEFDVRYAVRAEELIRIPAEGPVVVVCNHPFGGLDAIILSVVLMGVRPDARILANHLLARIPQVGRFILPVDPFGGTAAARRNVHGMQRALAHLQGGGLLGVFPSGAVSHWQWRRRAVEDPPWTNHVHRLVQRSGATVVPAFFPGRNGALFQVAGCLHPLLRTALIPREAARARGRTLRLLFGRPLAPSRLKRMEDPAQFMHFLRLQTYVLAGASEKLRGVLPGTAEPAPLAPAEDPDVLAREVETLPAEDVLLRDGTFLVGVARQDAKPVLMREIGRLREETFRVAGEGSGQARDIDWFDEHYLQLFLWDTAARRVAGGYRLVRVDDVLRAQGSKGLYITSLFRFRPGFLRKLGPAMELGRSWIHPDYQRKYNALALMWRGIATLIARRPECAVLLGPVSISRDYQALSRGLIVSFLKHTRLDRKLAAFVRPSRPYKLRGRVAQLARDVGDAVHTIDDVSMFVSEIESDGKGIPLLFRHYLRLHSIVLSFNVDPAFADVVDGLLLTDLRRTDRTLLRRLMGADNYERFAAYHGIGDARGTREAVTARG